MRFRILVIDDEQSILQIFSVLLEENGYAVETSATGEDGIGRALAFRPDIVLLDMNLPDVTGLEALARIRQALPETDIVIITAFGTIRNAVEATKLGAAAYLEKPVDNEELLLAISRLVEVKRLHREVEDLKSELSSRYRFSNIIGVSRQMNSVFQMMGRIARVEGTVLITGESGTGKELIARAIHFESPRRDGPFVVVNCGAIPKDLIESEFFGHTRGAFTDAKSEKIGKFELARGGTIFLDEVGELSPEAQVKLLRVLSEREIVKVGGTETVPVDVRVIAATNRNLEEAVRKGEYREDLYWRLAVLSIHLPPLRERPEDLPLLCDFFVNKFGRELGKAVRGISPRALELFAAYPWPGNIRELESVLYEVMVMTDAPLIDEEHLPARIRESTSAVEAPAGQLGRPLGEIVAGLTGRAEKDAIERALEATGWNKTRAAELLGISRKTLFNKMTALGIRSRD